MNYITSCPACETQFLLTIAHLKAHRGKVQCGHCEHIFNAKNRLTEVSDNIQSTAQYIASVESSKQASTPITEDKPINEVLDGVLGAVPNLENLNVSSTLFSETKEHFIGNQTHIEIEDNYSYKDEAPIKVDDLATSPKFKKEKVKFNIWLLLLSALLICLAALQSIYFYRTKIAAEYPQFKPYLTQACATLQCNIDLPNNLDLFTIDDSDMQENESYEKVIEFSSLLINKANYAQAYPNIELTLTDANDQPVIRRMIKPSEYLNEKTDVTAGMSSKDEVRVKLTINVADLSVAGYRVSLAY